MGLEQVEFVLSLEEAFRITVSEEEAAEMATVGNVFDIVAAKLPDGLTYTDSSLWEKISELVLLQGDFRSPKQQFPLIRDTRLIEDLGWG